MLFSGNAVCLLVHLRIIGFLVPCVILRLCSLFAGAFAWIIIGFLVPCVIPQLCSLFAGAPA